MRWTSVALAVVLPYVAVVFANARSPRAAGRLAMVEGVNALVTISGKRHTEVIVEQALDLGVPVLPIPTAGGDSEVLFPHFREDIAARFEQTAFERCMDRYRYRTGRQGAPQSAAVTSPRPAGPQGDRVAARTRVAVAAHRPPRE